MINENKFLGTGWSFPPEFSNGGATVQTVSGEEDIQQSLHLLLTTSVKERIMQSNYGCDLKNYVFENISQALNNDIKSTISDAILNHESRVALEDVILENVDAASGILIDGDMVFFNPLQGAAIVAVQPGKIKASGKTKIKGKKVCIQGDETKVKVANCLYSTIAFPSPGQGTLKIESLASNQVSKKSNSGDTPLLLKGVVFNSKFEVTTPAKSADALVSDQTPFYQGKGQFIPNNNTIKAT